MGLVCRRLYCSAFVAATAVYSGTTTAVHRYICSASLYRYRSTSTSCSVCLYPLNRTAVWLYVVAAVPGTAAVCIITVCLRRYRSVSATTTVCVCVTVVCGTVAVDIYTVVVVYVRTGKCV